jgi:uncharacterized membrane protein YgcG
MFAFVNVSSVYYNVNIKNELVSTKRSFLKNKGLYSKNKNFKKLTVVMKIEKDNIDLVKKLILSCILFTPLIVTAVPDIRPEQKIIDESGNLTKSSVSYIEKNIQKVNELNGGQVYFISLRTLPFDTTASDYAKQIFEKWNLSQKDVVVVLVNKIAKAGIFYGSDVNGLNSENTLSIGEQTYSFKAKEEQYSSAAIDVSNRLVSILTNKGDPGPPVSNREENNSKFKSAKATEQKRSKYIAIIVVLLIIAFVVPMVQFFYYVKDE